MQRPALPEIAEVPASENPVLRDDDSKAQAIADLRCGNANQGGSGACVIQAFTSAGRFPVIPTRGNFELARHQEAADSVAADSTADHPRFQVRRRVI